MKEKNVDEPFDVRDFVGGEPSFNGGNQQSVQNNETPLSTEQTVLSVPTESTEPTRHHLDTYGEEVEQWKRL